MSKLDQLKAAFKNSNKRENASETPNNYYNFWDMDFEKTAIVRFVPDKNPDNPMQFMVEKHVHELQINGQKRKVPCLKQYGDDCPICKVSAQYYKDGDKENGLKYYRKKSYVAQALIIQDPIPVSDQKKAVYDGELRYLSITSQIFKVIQDAFESGDLDKEPYAFNGGYNFVIKKTQQGDKANYVVGTKFQARPSNLTEEQIEFVEEHSVDLKSLLPQKPVLEKVEAMLQAALTGQQYTETRASSSNDKDPTIAEQLASAMNVAAVDKEDSVPFNTDDNSVVAKAVDKSETVDAEEEEADALIRKIRERRNARAS